jgi:hypothetical protein
MSRLSWLLVVAVVLMSGSVHAEDWKLGQTWTYLHEGPRPYSDALSTVEGDRVVTVTGIKGAGAAKRYILKNIWGKNDPNPATSYFDAKALIHQTDIDSLATILFNPPIPGFWTSLKVGEQKVLKTNMSVSGLAIPLTFTVKRLVDEILIVPAGKFTDCIHVQIISSMENPMGGGSSQTKTDQWYHPQVKNFVKEKIVTNFQADNSYAATSVLKAFTPGN